MENILGNLWDIAETLIRNIGMIWQWLNEPLKLVLNYLGLILI